MTSAAAGLEVAADVVEQRLLVLDQARDLDAEDHVVASGKGIARTVAMVQADAIGETEPRHAPLADLDLAGRDRAAVQHEMRMAARDRTEIGGVAAAEIEHAPGLVEIDRREDRLLERALAAAQRGVFVRRGLAGEEGAQPGEAGLWRRHQAEGEMAFAAVGMCIVMARCLGELIVEAGDLLVADFRGRPHDRRDRALPAQARASDRLASSVAAGRDRSAHRSALPGRGH